MPRWTMSDKMFIKDIIMRIKFVFSEPRWSIIKVIGDETKGTNEIYEELLKRGIGMPRSTLYYHISSLENEGIIEMAGYREEGGGAPEKLWKLNVKRICVDIISGEMKNERGEQYENSNTERR